MLFRRKNCTEWYNKHLRAEKWLPFHPHTRMLKTTPEIPVVVLTCYLRNRPYFKWIKKERDISVSIIMLLYPAVPNEECVLIHIPPRCLHELFYESAVISVENGSISYPTHPQNRLFSLIMHLKRLSGNITMQQCN